MNMLLSEGTVREESETDVKPVRDERMCSDKKKLNNSLCTRDHETTRGAERSEGGERAELILTATQQQNTSLIEMKLLIINQCDRK